MGNLGCVRYCAARGAVAGPALVQGQIFPGTTRAVLREAVGKVACGCKTCALVHRVAASPRHHIPFPRLLQFCSSKQRAACVLSPSAAAACVLSPRGLASSSRSIPSANVVAAWPTQAIAPTATAFKAPIRPVAGGRAGARAPPPLPSPSSASSCFASGGSPNLGKGTARARTEGGGWVMK